MLKIHWIYVDLIVYSLQNWIKTLAYWLPGVYTHLVMQQSLFPEIRKLSERRSDVEDYWADVSDNIKTVELNPQSKDKGRGCLIGHVKNGSSNSAPPLIIIDSPKGERARVSMDRFEMSEATKLPNLDVLCLKEAWTNDSEAISPNLDYNLDSWFAQSPNQFSPCSPKPNSNQKTQRNYFTFDNINENRWLFDDLENYRRYCQRIS